jgi:phosphoserine phosphatase
VSGGRVAIFDVCDTLYACNTTIAYIRYVLRTSGNAKRLVAFERLVRRWSPSYVAAGVATRLSGRDVGQMLALRHLAGYERQMLDALASAFAASELPARANPPIHAALHKHVRDGDTTLLLSNSLDVVVQAVAAQLGVAGVGSKLVYARDVCLGRLEANLEGSKHLTLRARLGADAENLTVYTDNLSDRALLAMADQRNVVIPRGASRRSWGNIDAIFIEL